MKSYALCPVSDKMINERVARINGVFTLALLIVYGVTQNIIPVLFLAFDFLLRSSEYSKYSLVAISETNLDEAGQFLETTLNYSELLIIPFILIFILAIKNNGVV